MPRIYVLSGPDIGKSFDVDAGAVLGRAAECAVHLRDPSVSRHHARLELEHGRWTIVDTQSRNGVYAGGQRVPSAGLEDGDEILVGEVLLRFRTSAGAQNAPEPPAASPPALAAAPPAPATAPLAPDPRAPSPPSRPSVEPEGIALEGDWDSAAATRAPAIPRAPVSAAPQVSLSTSPAAPQADLARTMLSAPRPTAPATRGPRVLQYKKIADRPGFLAAEVGQQPLWIRFGVWTLALALFGALFLVAFKGAAFLKGRTERGDAAVEGEEVR